jgi:predicted small lipoprotein YifL
MSVSKNRSICYADPRSGGRRVIQPPSSARAGHCCTRFGHARFGHASRAGFAALAALAAALALAGCGRKAGLDAPPMAAAGDLQGSGQPGAAPAAAGKPAAAAVEKRKTPLDWLID